MSGFDNDVVYAKNADFTQADNQAVSEANGLATNGQLWIGTTTANAGGTHINVGTLTSPLGTLSIGYSTPNITLDLVGGSTGVDSFTPDNGTTPVVPNVSGNVSIFGLSGSKTTGSLNTLTIKSPPYADFPATSTATVNSGSFITAGGNIILNLPTPAADGDLVEVVCTTANLVAIDAPAANFIRIGTLITSGGGTATSTQIGDAVCLRYRLADLTWYATSVVGTWVMA